MAVTTYKVGLLSSVVLPLAHVVGILGATQDSTEHLHHHGQAVTLVPGWGREHETQ